jgi:hypothetical protein
MRLYSLTIAATALICAGCSHNAAKTEAAADTAAAAAATTTVEKAKTETAKVTPTEDVEKVECSVKGDERIIEARAKNKGCELAYTKAGKEGVVASSSHGTEYCKKALERLRDKLKGAGYDCK